MDGPSSLSSLDFGSSWSFHRWRSRIPCWQLRTASTRCFNSWMSWRRRSGSHSKSLYRVVSGLSEWIAHAAIIDSSPALLVVDITILPRFQSTKNATQEQFAETQHLLVFLWSYWNTVLLHTAAQWAKGEVIVPDPNSLIVEQIRVGQLHSTQISDASGTGKQAPLFEYAEQPCLSTKQDDDAPNLQTAGVEKCIDPSQHLFWSAFCNTNALSHIDRVPGTISISAVLFII